MTAQRPPLTFSDLLEIHYNGPKGETLFHTPYLTLTAAPEQREASELLFRLGAGKDDRSMALLSALVCEKYLDRTLGMLMPRYKQALLNGQAATFSTKIKVLSALDIIPRHITKAADLVRSVRNKFAHKLDLDHLGELPDDLRNQIKDYCASRVTNATPEDIADLKACFKVIVDHATGVLLSYATSMDLLNKAIREPSFVALLMSNPEALKEIAGQYLLANPVQSGVGTPGISGGDH